MYYSRFKTFCGWLTFNDEVVFVFLMVLFLSLFPMVATADFRQEYENIALGKGYTLSPAPHSSYPDSGGELTDGINFFNMDAQVGWLDAGGAVITLNLEENLSGYYGFVGYFMRRDEWAVHLPASVQVSVSEDGSGFNSVGFLQRMTNDEETINRYELVLSDNAVFRYVRFTIASGGAWFMCDEVEVFMESADIDLNNDGFIDFSDIAVFVSYWIDEDCNNGGPCFEADFDESGRINFIDFGYIADEWLRDGTFVFDRILMGSFIQPWLVMGWAANNWSTEFGYMKDVYMDHIIWQWMVKTDSNICYYPSVLGFTQQGSDPVGKSLQAAQVAGIEVWLGLNWSDEWWSNSNNETWLTNEFNLSKLIAQELWDIYGSTYGDTIAGFYLTMEMDNVNFQTTASQDRMKTVYRDVCDYIHNNMNKPVMVAPFYNESVGQNPSQYAAMWGYILETAPIDVIAVQDGIGVGHSTIATVGPWFEAMREAIAVSRPQTQLWSDLETFNQDPVCPADISRIINQIDAEYGYVEKLTSFSFNHYQSPQQGHVQEYNDYKSYVDSIVAK